MSKLTSKLDRIFRTAAPPIGFRKSEQETDIPPMALIVDLTKSTAKKAKSISAERIDAAIINSSSEDADHFKDISAAVGGLPLGLWISEESNTKEIEQLIDLNWDFVIFNLQTPIELLSKQDKGKILIVEPSVAPALIRVINELNFQIDGIMVSNNNSAITMKFLLTCQLFAEMLNKPLLVNTQLSLVPNELSNLQACGVKGLLLPEGSSQKFIAEVKKEIDLLPRTVKRKAGKGAVLPHLSFQTETSTEKVEEEEEEDDGEDI